MRSRLSRIVQHLVDIEIVKPSACLTSTLSRSNLMMEDPMSVVRGLQGTANGKSSSGVAGASLGAWVKSMYGSRANEMGRRHGDSASKSNAFRASITDTLGRLFGFIVELPMEPRATSTVEMCKGNEADARKFMRKRMAAYFGALMQLHPEVKEITFLTGWWRLDAIDSPTYEDFLKGSIQQGSRLRDVDTEEDENYRSMLSKVENEERSKRKKRQQLSALSFGFSQHVSMRDKDFYHISPLHLHPAIRSSLDSVTTREGEDDTAEEASSPRHLIKLPQSIGDKVTHSYRRALSLMMTEMRNVTYYGNLQRQTILTERQKTQRREFEEERSGVKRKIHGRRKRRN